MKNWLVLLVVIFASLPCTARNRFAEVKIETIPVAESVYMLVGAGGNIGVSAGDDGVLIVDDQFAPLAEKIDRALQALSGSPTKYVINTHYHGDHTGSNEFFQKKKGATVFAHDNVRIRLASNEKISVGALPVVTYEDGIKFHLNGDTIHVIHLEKGHTDGDSVVWFEKSNVLHTGDLFFAGLFPYIDLGAGGDVKGYIESVETLLSRISEDTKIIPGHGPLSTKQDLKIFVEMIKETYAYVQKLKQEGMSEDKIIEKGLDAKWNSWTWNFINEARWIKTLYQ
ncbi:MBL fold metallo-hydrolase [Agaribacter flavus]|uniref:MBL fold metallo-hydrolase n=1 Tax=Agaribacter flavus TaxID=1902781 RepID=A0ABV7FQ01_9ALTE